MSEVTLRLEFLRWVGEIACAIGLSEWEIEVKVEELPEDVLARCHVPRARQAARIVIGTEFLAGSAEEQRATMVHELMHCHFAQVVEVTEESLPAILGRPAWTIFETGHDLALERCLEAVAVAFAAKLPLPPEVE
jgi:hypothetical protein